MASSVVGTLRPYSPADFESVSAFLIKHFLPGNADGNWFQPAWEYMHSHPALDEASLGRVGIWENADGIVGVAHFESSLGEAFFQVHPAYTHLKAAMLEDAENHLCGEAPKAKRDLRAYITDFDAAFEALARSRGYQVAGQYARPVAELSIPQPIPKIKLPEGFRLKSLADDNDLRKVHRLLWRGLNHEGGPPEAGIEERRKMQSGPNFRKDLTIVVEGATGDPVSYCGTWYEPVNKIACVEPVATGPDYRRRRLGHAAVWEGIRRCQVLGASAAYVGSELSFYKSMGFTKRYDGRCWPRQFGSRGTARQ
jgi:predicted N-acetyltransferase YhbS